MKIEDRKQLRKIKSSDWNKAFEKYKEEINCPKELKTEEEQLMFLLSHAIKLEYGDNVDQYRSMTAEKLKETQKTQSSAPSVKSVNPFDNLDCEFRSIFIRLQMRAKQSFLCSFEPSI
jgi:RLL motif-containing protein 1